MEGEEPEGREEGNLEALWFLSPAPRICEAEGRIRGFPATRPRDPSAWPSFVHGTEFFVDGNGFSVDGMDFSID